MSKQVVAALYDLYCGLSLLFSVHGALGFLKDIVLHGQKPLSSECNVWVSVVLSTARAPIKMVNNSLSASLRAVQIFWLCF